MLLRDVGKSCSERKVRGRALEYIGKFACKLASLDFFISCLMVIMIVV